MSGLRGAARLLVGVLAVLLLLTAISVAADELEKRIKTIEEEIAELRELFAAAQQGGAQAERLAEIERRIEILAAEVEKLRIGEAAASADESQYGLGPAASKVYRTQRGVSIGGYGEILYENFESQRQDGVPSEKTDQLDLLRAVLYVGYKFDDRFLFNSEIEFEHVSTGKSGEVGVEFAYVDYFWKSQINPRVGLVLIPMGLVNELHEPPVYLTSERPETELRIIPTTWRESGAGLFGDLGPITYRSYVVNGFDARGFNSEGLREGRQEGSEAKAQDFAWVGRFDYVGTPGLIVGGSAYFGNSGQGIEGTAGQTLDVATSILEAHVDWRWRGLRLRALGTAARLSDVAQLNATLGLTGAASIGEKMSGSYLEAGYDVFAWRGTQSALIPYARWERVDTQEEVPTGWLSNPANDDRIVTVGVAYQPIRQLIVKLDYQDRSNGAKTGVNQANVAAGYIF